MIIHVTQGHISEGITLDCGRCPVALALSEATGKEWIISSRAMCYKNGSMLGWSEDKVTPDIVARKITEFDATGKMEPFSFTLEDF